MNEKNLASKPYDAETLAKLMNIFDDARDDCSANEQTMEMQFCEATIGVRSEIAEILATLLSGCNDDKIDYCRIREIVETLQNIQRKTINTLNEFCREYKIPRYRPGFIIDSSIGILLDDLK